MVEAGLEFRPFRRPAHIRLLGYLLCAGYYLCSFPKAAVTQYHKLGDFKQQTFILTTLEAGSPTSRCGRAVLTLQTLRKGLFCASLLASGGDPNPWHSSASGCTAPISAPV